IGLKHVNGEHDQVFTLKFLRDFVHDRSLGLAVLAPGSPELEQHNLALNRLVVELLVGSSLGAKARRGLSNFIARESGETEKCSLEKTYGDDAAPKHAAHRSMECTA